MKLLFFIIALLFAAALITLYALDNPGYVLIAHAPWSIEMSLTLFIPLMIVVSFLFYLSLYIILRLWRIPRDVGRWRTRRRARRARMALLQGLTNLAEANWVEAETQLLAGMRHGDTPLLNYLGAAMACEGQGNSEKRDEYLALAHKNASRYDLAIGMTQAYLQHQARQLEQSLATLNELRGNAPKHRQVLKLLAQVHLELRDWTGLIELLPDLRQSYAMTAKEVDALELQAHRELLKLSLPSGKPGVLEKAWNAVPKTLRRNPSMIAIYARQLIQQGEMERAESVLRAAIEDGWDSTLVELYGQAPGKNTAEQLETAEGWLSSHRGDPKLLLTLARLALHNKQDGKARGYFEQCLTLHGPSEAYHELGNLMERLGEKDKALNYYRRGLEMYANELRATPAREQGSPASRFRAVR
ncbi:heme biosynthesis HemY N-terminal domain-containing protein [Sulfuricaulis sp.]|uniref:heme biosynthesis HemY N-terminal domain-containing protein n=1 Tax=Sulfuricaulis sp. TaxID=2003553 RepID=UPI00355A6E73